MIQRRRSPVLTLASIVCLLCAHPALVFGQLQSDARSAGSMEIQAEIPSLKDVLAPYFTVGAAIWQGDITGPHSELLRKHFNSITTENAMKWSSLEPRQGQLNLTIADMLVNFAVANNIRVRGHTLVWHRQYPEWVFKDDNGADLQTTPESKALVLQRMEKHIREEVGHFKDRVYAWDVVNEVIDPEQPDGFRRSPWFLYTGTDYIERAFRVAHEVAPEAKLYINDYDTTDPKKRAFLLKLVKDLRKRKVPIYGVGHQMHSRLDYPSPEAIVQTIKMFSKLHVDNQITELDMSLYPDKQSTELVAPEQLLIRQGYRYRDFFDALRKLRGKISSVTLWGMADDHTWLSHQPVPRRDLPLLFDEHLQAKYAYWGIVDPARLPKQP